MFNILLDTTAAAAGDTTAAAGSSWTGYIGTFVMIAAMVAIFYFLLYRPQKKQEKAAREMRDSLEVGDEVTTIGGIIGAVSSIKGETVTIETGKDRSKIRVLRSAIKTIDVKASENEKESEE